MSDDLITAKIGETLYCFMGQSIIEFKVLEDGDDCRVYGEDGANFYTFYKAHCYRSKEAAFVGMTNAMIELSHTVLDES